MDTPTTVFGIDADTQGIAWCQLDVYTKRVQCEGYIVRAYKTRGLAATYYYDLERFINMIGEHTVYLEDVFCRSRTGYRSLCRVQGEILYEAHSRAYTPLSQVVLVPAITWQSWLFKSVGKKKLAGCGNTKDKALVCANARVRDAVLASEHAVDAACIAYYGAVKILGELDKEPTA